MTWSFQIKTKLFIRHSCHRDEFNGKSHKVFHKVSWRSFIIISFFPWEILSSVQNCRCSFDYFPHHIVIIWTENHPLKVMPYFYVDFPIFRAEWPEDDSYFKVFYHQIIANFPWNVTKRATFLKQSRSLCLFQKIEKLFEKKSSSFQIVESGKCNTYPF